MSGASEDAAVPPTGRARPSMFRLIARTLRNNILVGLVLITPLAITVFVGNALFKFLTHNAFFKFLAGLLPESMRDTGYELIVARIVALLIGLMILFLIGFSVRSFLGKQVYRLAEMVVERIPLFNKIYIWVRQISEAFLAQRQTLFKEVVLIEYPRKGIFSVAFVTAPVAPELGKIVPQAEKEAFVSLFIPTTPNPTSGLMIIAPRADLTTLPISIAEAMKLIISAGAVYPGTEVIDSRPTLVDKLEAWISRDPKAQM
jgi:uncharacterized membrane protein